MKRILFSFLAVAIMAVMVLGLGVNAIGEEGVDIGFFEDAFAKGVFELGLTENTGNDYGLEFVEYDEEGLTQIWMFGDVTYVVGCFMDKETNVSVVEKIMMEIVEEIDGVTYSRGFVKQNPNPNVKKGINETTCFGYQTTVKKGKIDKKNSGQYPVTLDELKIAFESIFENPIKENIDDLVYYAERGIWQEMSMGYFGIRVVERLRALGVSDGEDKLNEYGLEFVSAGKGIVKYAVESADGLYYSIFCDMKMNKVAEVGVLRDTADGRYGFTRKFPDPKKKNGVIDNQILVIGAEYGLVRLSLSNEDFLEATTEFMAEPTEEKFFSIFERFKDI